MVEAELTNSPESRPSVVASTRGLDGGDGINGKEDDQEEDAEDEDDEYDVGDGSGDPNDDADDVVDSADKGESTPPRAARAAALAASALASSCLARKAVNRDGLWIFSTGSHVLSESAYPAHLIKYSIIGFPSAIVKSSALGRSSRMASAKKVFDLPTEAGRAGLLPLPDRFALSEDCESGDDCGRNPSGALGGAYWRKASIILSVSLSLSVSLPDSLASM